MNRIKRSITTIFALTLLVAGTQMYAMEKDSGTSGTVTPKPVFGPVAPPTFALPPVDFDMDRARAQNTPFVNNINDVELFKICFSMADKTADRGDLQQKLDAAVALLQQGANPNFVSPQGAQSPLHVAVLDRRASAFVHLLIKWGADVNKETLYKKTPLHIAAHHNNDSAIYYLMDHGATETQDSDNHLPEHYAGFGKNKLVKPLFEKPTADDHSLVAGTYAAYRNGVMQQARTVFGPILPTDLYETIIFKYIPETYDSPFVHRFLPKSLEHRDALFRIKRETRLKNPADYAAAKQKEERELIETNYTDYRNGVMQQATIAFGPRFPAELHAIVFTYIPETYDSQFLPRNLEKEEGKYPTQRFSATRPAITASSAVSSSSISTAPTAKPTELAKK